MGHSLPIPGLTTGRRLMEIRQCALKCFPRGLSHKDQNCSDSPKSEAETSASPRELQKAELENNRAVCWGWLHPIGA